MKIFYAVIIALVLVALPTVALNVRNTESEVLAVEREIADAQIKSDLKRIEQLLAKDYTFTIPDGTVVTRAKFLQDMKDWWKPIIVENTDQQIRLYGNTAVVIGKARYQWKGKNGIEEAREQYTDTYVKSGRQWQRASSHSSCLSGRCS